MAMQGAAVACRQHWLQARQGRQSCRVTASASAPPAVAPPLRRLPPFELERYFAKYEFTAPYQLCCSDTQPLSLAEALELADTDARARWEALSLAYTETQGLPALREAVAAGQYASIAPHEVVVAAPQELISLAMLALCQPGDHVVVTHPGYQSLYAVAESLGCDVSYWAPTCGPGGELSFNMGQLLAALRDDTKLVVVNFPHNPTGFLPSPQQWAQLVEACRACGAYLFSDEMYRGLEFDPQTRLPSAPDAYPERGVALGGCSKAVGMPGIRVGWLATHDAMLIQRVLELKDYSSICSSAPSEVLALIAVRAWDCILTRQLDICKANVGLVHQFMGRWGRVMRWQVPRAGSVAFPQLVVDEPAAGFCKALVDEAGVLLLPGEVYGHPQSVAQRRFRLGFGRRSLPECVGRLDAWLAQRYPHQGSGGRTQGRAGG